MIKTTVFEYNEKTTVLEKKNKCGNYLVGLTYSEKYVTIFSLETNSTRRFVEYTEVEPEKISAMYKATLLTLLHNDIKVKKNVYFSKLPTEVQLSIVDALATIKSAS